MVDLAVVEQHVRVDVARHARGALPDEQERDPAVAQVMRREQREPEMTRSRSPCAAATQIDRRSSSAAISSRTSRVWPGSRARRPPSRSCKVSGIGRARPGTGACRCDELAPQLQREEGIARRRLLHPGELGARQVEAESLLEQPMHRGQTERADRDPLEPSVRERALQLERLRELRGLSQGREETDRLVVQASKRDLDRTHRRGSATARRRGRQGPAPARTRTGRPAPQARLACGSGGVAGLHGGSATSDAAAAEARASARPRRARRPAAPRAR